MRSPRSPRACLGRSTRQQEGRGRVVGARLMGTWLEVATLLFLWAEARGLGASKKTCGTALWLRLRSPTQRSSSSPQAEHLVSTTRNGIRGGGTQLSGASRGPNQKHPLPELDAAQGRFGRPGKHRGATDAAYVRRRGWTSSSEGRPCRRAAKRHRDRRTAGTQSVRGQRLGRGRHRDLASAKGLGAACGVRKAASA